MRQECPLKFNIKDYAEELARVVDAWRRNASSHTDAHKRADGGGGETVLLAHAIDELARCHELLAATRESHRRKQRRRTNNAPPPSPSATMLQARMLYELSYADVLAVDQDAADLDDLLDGLLGL